MLHYSEGEKFGLHEKILINERCGSRKNVFNKRHDYINKRLNFFFNTASQSIFKLGSETPSHKIHTFYPHFSSTLLCKYINICIYARIRTNNALIYTT